MGVVPGCPYDGDVGKGGGEGEMVRVRVGARVHGQGFARGG